MTSLSEENRYQYTEYTEYNTVFTAVAPACGSRFLASRHMGLFLLMLLLLLLLPLPGRRFELRFS